MADEAKNDSRLDLVLQKRRQYEQGLAAATSEEHAAQLRELISVCDRIIEKSNAAGDGSAAIPSQSRPTTAISIDPPEPREPLDLIWGVVVAGVFLLHIIYVVLDACPFWFMCLIPAIGAWLWRTVAGVMGFRMIARSVGKKADRQLRRFRIGLAIVLLLLAVDSITGGDYRWFELGMRRKLWQCGGSAMLQAWAQTAADSPPYSTYQGTGDTIDLKTLPPAIQKFSVAIGHTALFSHNGNGQLFFYFDDGGWDMGWGIVVGKKDMTDPSLGSGIPQLHHWIKKIEPGIYIFAKD